VVPSSTYVTLVPSGLRVYPLNKTSTHSVGRMHVHRMTGLSRLDALHYLFTKKTDRVVAHCLDLDLVAVAGDIDTAEHRLDSAVKAHIAWAYAAGNNAALSCHAPREYWISMNRATQIANKLLFIETVPPMTLPVEKTVIVAVELPVFRAEVPLADAA